MRWQILFVLLILLPGVSATWYYGGDTFTIDGTVYSVGAFADYNKVLLGVGSRSHVIMLGECAKEGLSEYCYVRSAYPSDDTHIKYAAGNKLYGFDLSISTVKPAVGISRTSSTASPRIGDDVLITVTVENTGDYSIQNFRYTEPVPEGMRLVSGTSLGSSVLQEYKTVAPDDKRVFSYTLRPIDYVDAKLNPNITYTFEGKEFFPSLAPLTFFVETPLVIARGVPSTIPLGGQGTYTVNVSNRDKSEPMTVKVSMQMPKELKQMGITGLTPGSNNTYLAEFELEPQTNATVSYAFYAPIVGTYRIPLDITGTVHGTTFTRHYEESVTAKADKLAPSIKLSSSKLAYVAGDPLTISCILENVNDAVTFKTIAGTLSAPGLFEAEDFKHEAFGPKRKLTEAEVVAVIPQVEEAKVFTIICKGQYATPAGEIFEYETSKGITVNPLREAVKVTRSIQPSVFGPGMNITIRVSGQNVYGQYATFTATDMYPPQLARVGGLSFAETSLERDQSKELYTYQLEIPQNYTGAFNITTSILLKGEVSPVKTVLPVYVNVTPPEDTVAEENGENRQDGGSEGSEELRKKGFFARTWAFLKEMFT
jgi:uncharacterized repeat protein (TIGR01451 family)